MAMMLAKMVTAKVSTKALKRAALLGAFAAISPAAGWAQAQPGPETSEAVQRQPIIQAINISGNQRIESGTIRSYLPMQAGQPVDQLAIDAGLKTLFATGLFADAAITYDGAVLNVAVEENPIVNRVIFDGNKSTKEDKFTEEVQLTPRAVYTRAKVQADAQRIIEIYRRSGRFAANVTPKIVELPQNRVDVVFEIEEGAKTGVAKVNFLGNTAFSDAELRQVVLTAESHWWDILESNDNFDPDRMEYDRQLLREYYTRQGYADFNVLSAVAELTPDRKDFFITFTVEEGPQYTFGKVDVKTTLDKLSEDRLKNFLPMRRGAEFNSELLESAEESITYATGIAGYAFVDVRPDLTLNREAKTADVTFTVNEGPRVYVERINVRGNTQTLDKVIRREMRLSEGDAFNRVLVDRSKRRVQGLGYFGEVEIEELPGSAPDRTVLDVAVSEQSTGSFQVGAGLSSADAFIVNFQVEQRNLLGRGQYMLLDLQASSRTSSARVSFTEPYFLGRPLRAGFSAFANRTDFREAGYTADTLGAGVNMGFPVSEYGSIGLNYQLRSDNVEFSQLSSQALSFGQDPTSILLPGVSEGDVDNGGYQLDAAGNVVSQVCNFISQQINPTCASAGDFVTSQVGYSLRFDTRDNPLVPSRGWRFDVGQSFAGLGGDVNYLQTTAKASAYRPLPYNFVGAVKVDVGYVDGFGDDGVRINDRYFKGGNRGFRGFDVAGVGPRYFDGQFDRAIGGRAYAIGSLEARIPLPVKEDYGIRASLFTDFGSVGIVDEKDKLINTLSSNRTCEVFDSEGNKSRQTLDPDNISSTFDGTVGACFLPIEDDFSLRASAGVSINWRSPFGPVQIDIAEAFLAEEYDEKQVFRFSAGGSF